MKTNTIIKRICAYFIDFIVITLISAGIARITFINPNYDEYYAKNAEYTKALDDYYAKEITIDELNSKVTELSYDLNKSGYMYIIGDIIIVFLYFGGFAYYTKGQTLGKKLMNLKLTSKNGGEVKLYQYFIRAFITYSIILKILTLIAICFNRSTFNSIFSIASTLDNMLLLIILLSMLLNKEGRGLHDFLAGTKVVDLKYPITNELEKEKTGEIEVIKPKKEVKKKNKKEAEDE